MNKLTLGLSLFLSFSTFAANNDCEVATQMFNDAGELIALSTDAAKGSNTEKLSNSKVTASEFNQWSKVVFAPKMNKLVNKYAQYQSVSSNSPIYVGNAVIVETDNYIEALTKFTATHDKQYILSLREIMGRVTDAHDALKTHCTK
ncbi:hypothetical protein ACQZ19_13595 [Rahnella variigena]|uniref:hypothetical protein n=1 Tax=Rahnella variigena TaxID=574964 RepID=UPI003D2E5E5F